MANRPPISSSSPGLTGSFRKRRRGGPNLIYILASLFVLGGIALLIVWMSGPGKPLNTLFATETPTPTVTSTPTSTNTPTLMPTETETPTITPTATFSSPFTYTVQEGDYLALIVERFGLGDDGIELILLLNQPYTDEDGNFRGIDPATQVIVPGQVILLPNPGMQLPTATSIPPDLPRGTKVTYTVQAGDSLGAIAAKFNSTIDAIIAENNIENPNALFVGQQLIIPVNMVTPTATRPPTSTPITPGPGTVLPTATFTPIN